MTDKDILHHLERQPAHAAGYKQLVRELGLRGGPERRELDERLRKLVDRGDVVEVGRDRYALPKAAARSNLIAGVLSMHRDGYGFVTPESDELRARISGDIYIAPPEVGTAMHGDRVLVEIGPVRADGRAEGRIVKIARRRHNTVVGTFHYGDRYNSVKPFDEKITQAIVIPEGAEWPSDAAGPEEAGPHTSAEKKQRGREQASRHRVIGEEARRRELDGLEGVVVDVEITEWPTTTKNPRGRVIEILGYEDDFGVDTEIVIRKHHLPHYFPDAVLHEAEAISPVIQRHELAEREDFRNLPIVTIDGETARDFDDAVLVQRLPSGNYELQVHIADVAHYVTPGTALDDEARERGTSVYFPDRAVPMLPLELSTDICSLRPNVERLVMSCVMEIDHAGDVVGYELMQGVIRSAARMTYNQVQAVLDGDMATRRQFEALVPEFERMAELARLLNRKRQKRGSIDFDLPEAVIDFDEQGLMQGVSRSERKFAHRLIEEFMLAANECVAGYLEGKGVASLYRIHEKPEAKKVYEFETTAAAFGYSLGVGALPIKRVHLHGDSRRFQGRGRNPRPVEIPEDVHITPRMYQKLTEKIAGKPEERILSYLMLRSLKQARYSEVNEGHFALAAPTYTHFTSPIRRYPDLIVHRLLKEVLSDEHEGVGEVQGAPDHQASPWSKRRDFRDERGASGAKREAQKRLIEIIPEDELHDIAESSSETERRADDAERELIEWKKVKFMQDRVGEEFDALIVSVTKYGLFVELEELFIEGLVPLASLSDDRYTFRENTRQIIGEHSGRMYKLGQKVRVLLDRIDRQQRKLQFAIVEPELSPRERRRERGRHHAAPTGGAGGGVKSRKKERRERKDKKRGKRR